MALFKILKGNSANLPTNKVDGYCYVTLDEHKMYIDHKKSDNSLERFTLNATSADKLTVDAGSTTTPVYFKNGVPTEISYTINSSVPANAKFTDTNTKVTSVSNHYTPSADSTALLSADASGGSAATWNSTQLVTGVNLQRDAKGHVTGVTVDSVKMPANPNSNTAHAHTAGTGLSISGSGGTSGTTTYSLLAAGSTIGGVKTGGDVTISDGVITVNNNSHTHTIANITNLQTELDKKANKGAGIFYIEGTGTTAGVWLGQHDDITEYYNGLTIAYKIPVAGASTTTLKINDLDVITVKMNNNTALTTHYPVNSVLLLTYTTDSNVGYWKIANYDSNTKVTQASTTGNANYHLLMAYSTNIATSTASTTRKNASLYYNPASKILVSPTFSGALTGNASTATAFASAKSITLSGDITGTSSSTGGWAISATLANTGVTASSYGLAAAATPAFGSSFNVPYVTVDSKGRITSATTYTVTLPANPNTDSKVTNTASTTAKFFITGTTNSSTNTGGQVFNPAVYINGNTITATTFIGALSGNAATATYATSAGTATVATSLATSTAGSATKPVYFSGGKPIACSYVLEQNVGVNAKLTDTTYSEFVKSGSGAKAGLVPKPSTTAGTTKYLREDGTWQVPPDTNTTYGVMTGATSSAAGKSGLVPAPSAGSQAKFLRGDGTWVIPTDTNTTYTFATGDNNGEIKITPSGSSAFNVAIKGLNTAAYVSSATFASASHTHDYAPTSHTHSYVAKSGDTMTGNLMMKGANPYVGFQNASGSTKGYIQYVASTDVYAIGAGIANSLVITSTGSIQIPKNQSFTPATSGGTGTIGASNNVWQSMYATTFIGNLSGTATKVSKNLTIGSKTYNGSSAVSISASDLGLAQALRFVSSVSSLPSTTSGYSIGDVILVGNKEYVCTASNTWTELGDGSSYALNSIKVTGINGLTGGGALTSNQTISADLVSNTKLSNAASAATETAGRVYPVAMDKNGKLAVNVPWSNTTYGTATSSTAGLVKIGYSTSGKNYAVQLSDGKMFVNVPWTDNNTTYGTATSTTAGLVKIGYTQSGKNYPVQLSDGKMYVNVPWTDNNTTYTFTNSAATLAWGTSTTIATVGGTNITVSLPSNPNTDSKVAQVSTVANANYHLLFANSSSIATSTAATVQKNANLYYNPSTQTLNTTKLSFSNAVTLSYNSADKSLDFIFA